ncbi:pimeloyl-ACP methyl ester carboxylesterase [Bradyrhizobium sp. USDA 4472]
MQQKSITTDILDIAYLDYGAPDGWPCIMGHGFPYDVNAYAETAPLIAQAGARVLVPWLRGYGPTRFRFAETPRSGEQAALGADLLAFMDALRIDRAVVGGYDWGGRAACVISVLHPERVVGLVTGNSYNIQNIARSMEPASPTEEAALWYQYLFHNERGRRALQQNRRGFARQLWAMWFADVAIRRRHIREERGVVRQSGFRRRRDSLLSPPLCAGRRRSRLWGDRGEARCAAAGPRSHDRDRRRQRRRQSRNCASRAQV